MNIDNVDTKLQLSHALEKTHIQELRFDEITLTEHFKSSVDITQISINYWFRID